MTTEEIESLLRRARPAKLPVGCKRQILGSIAKPEDRPAFPRLAWPSLAACWSLILILRLTTPDVPQGCTPFDSASFLARNACMDRLLATGELDPPPSVPLRIESIFRLPAPKKSPTT